MGGATEYLVTGSSIIISTNIVPIIFSISVNLALCDNHISRTESFFLRLLLFVKDIMPLAGIIVTIWGSVVVFGAYSSWSAELELTNDDYCARPPFLCAFVLLILQWVLVPLLICIVLCTCFVGLSCFVCISACLCCITDRSSFE